MQQHVISREKKKWELHKLVNNARVAKFACPRVLDDRKMSEDNQKLRSGCPPDYQIFWKIILKIIVHKIL